MIPHHLLLPHLPHLAPRLAAEAWRRGLAVTRPDGTTQSIPITATPVVIEPEELERRVALAALLASASAKMSRAALASPELAPLLLDALSPLERRMALATVHATDTLATTRVDFFIGPDGAPQALEINATIPAMQGYSDIAVESWIDVVGEHVGIGADERERLKAENRPNAPALLDALESGYRKLRPGQPRPSHLALLCRPNDAQLTEQRDLARRFSARGLAAEVIHPAELAAGREPGFIYRHIFVRRLEEPGLAGAESVAALLERTPDERTVVLNPPASQIEVKTTFALLSQAVRDPALAALAGLSEEELEAIAGALPWTRHLRHGPTTDADGSPIGELVAEVAADPGRWVIKRAWDYGGRAVFIGANVGLPSFDERVAAAFGAPMPWAALCEACAQDRRGGGFVVQRFVQAAAQPHLLCAGPSGFEAAELYVDFSCYASVGLDHQPAWGGVCRGSTARVVNIVGGGGVLPLLTAPVAARFVGALEGASGGSRLPP